jgi:hypothetical protein
MARELMDDQVLNSFRFVVGAPRPIRLAVRGPRGGPPDEVVIDGPYGVIGRGAGSHLCLEGDDVGYRHAYLQVIGGRILCVDLLSRRGLEWDGATPGPWLSPEHRLRIGSYTLQLYDDGWSFDSELPSPLDFRPRSEQRPEYGVLPEVQLELAAGSGAGKAWPINRVLTLIGRDERCRITCSDDQISKVHCSLLLAPSGLWVIDLLGRTGVRVNGRQVPFAYLPHGSEFQIGKYKLRAVYAQVTQQPSIDSGPMSQDDRRSAAAFLTRHHQVFPVEIDGDVLVVTPQGDIGEFYYQDIHLESNQIVRLLQAHRFSSVVVDFRQVDLVGSIVLDSVATFCRNARGGATMCEAGPELLSVLETMNFPSIWPHFATRAAAIRALQTGDGSPAAAARPQ